MLSALSLHDFLTLAHTSNRVAVHQELHADHLTPLHLFEAFKDKMHDGVLLELGLQQENQHAFSYVMFGTLAQIKTQPNQAYKQTSARTSGHQTHPFERVRQGFKDFSYATAITPLHGAVGYLTYDAVRFFEVIPDRHATPLDHADMVFSFYQTTLRFDHQKQTIMISHLIEVGDHAPNAYHQAQAIIEEFRHKLNHIDIKTHPLSPSFQQPKVNVDVDDTSFMHLVEQAKQCIHRGDAFQIVLSRTFNMTYTTSPFEVYRALRQVCPAPYLFYFPTEQGILIGASPETLVCVNDGNVEINPIAGTRKRTQDDPAIEHELLNDPKECAEHRMLVDLARHDLGSLCVPGSINVPQLLKVKHFSHVSHITSRITGKLLTTHDALDALAAAFPAGTVSGAPKIRAMECIDALEPSRRGFYGGTICRLATLQHLESILAIRMAVLKEGHALFRTGAGIVHDSNPLAEAHETRQKAAGMIHAITLAEERFA